MPINLVKKGSPTFNICNICGKINLPDVAKKNSNAKIITTKDMV